MREEEHGIVFKFKIQTAPWKISVRNMDQKNELRTKYKKIRDELTEEQCRDWSAEICGHILGSGLYQRASAIYCYYPLKKEVALLPVMEDALVLGKLLAFPKVTGDDLVFCRIRSLAELNEGTFHIMEPFTGHVVNEDAALVLTPGVAFDMDGGRIGYGRGYYDRYFAEHENLTSVGIAYECQVLENFETDARDKKMDYLVTELGIRKL